MGAAALARDVGAAVEELGDLGGDELGLLDPAAAVVVVLAGEHAQAAPGKAR